MFQQIDGDKEVVGGVRAIATPGHTPGHTSYLVGSGKQQLLVLGDVTNISAVREKSGLACGVRYRRGDGRDQSAQDHGSRHRRQADGHRLSLQHAWRRHLQAGRKRVRLRSSEGLSFTTQIGGAALEAAPSAFGAELSELKREAGAAAARRLGLRVFHLERGADQIVHEIDFRSGHVVDRDRVDQNGGAIAVDHKVVGGFGPVDIELVLEARTSAAFDADAQHGSARLTFEDFADASCRPFADRDARVHRLPFRAYPIGRWPNG